MKRTADQQKVVLNDRHQTVLLEALKFYAEHAPGSDSRSQASEMVRYADNVDRIAVTVSNARIPAYV